MRIFIFIFSIFLIPRGVFANAHKQNLDIASSQYDRGEFESCDGTLNQIAGKFSELQLEEKEKFLIIKTRLAFVFELGEEKTKSFLKQIYELNPAFKLDINKDSPLSFKIWEELQGKNIIVADEKKELQIQKIDQKETTIKEAISFWPKILPFGFGHFDSEKPVKGSLFLMTEFSLLVGSSMISHSKEIRNGTPTLSSAYGTLLGVFGFGSLWAYEILDLMPDLYSADLYKARWTRYVLSIAPFGAAQAKNGHFDKAIALGLTQLSLISIAIASKYENIRTLAGTTFFITVLYGSYDGWKNHDWNYMPQEFTEKNNLKKVTIKPHIHIPNSGGGGSGAGLSISKSF